MSPRTTRAVVENGQVTVEVPFGEGTTVSVLLVPLNAAAPEVTHPLRGLPIRYDEPFEPVGLDDWEALR